MIDALRFAILSVILVLYSILSLRSSSWRILLYYLFIYYYYYYYIGSDDLLNALTLFFSISSIVVDTFS